MSYEVQGLIITVRTSSFDIISLHLISNVSLKYVKIVSLVSSDSSLKIML